jgi:hypothetical protein
MTGGKAYLVSGIVVVGLFGMGWSVAEYITRDIVRSCGCNAICATGAHCGMAACAREHVSRNVGPVAHGIPSGR